MKLIVGLGNPGKEHENTRHNVGFVFIDALAKHLGAENFGYEKKLQSKIAQAPHKLILAKPQTFMNKSGLAVMASAKFYKIKPKDIWVIHDDIDILWSKYKISFGRSSAGHKGVESVIKALKTKDFWRVRIGIQPSLKKHTPAQRVILKKFTPSELKTLGNAIKQAITKIETLFLR